MNLSKPSFFLHKDFSDLESIDSFDTFSSFTNSSSSVEENTYEKMLCWCCFFKPF